MIIDLSKSLYYDARLGNFISNKHRLYIDWKSDMQRLNSS